MIRGFKHLTFNIIEKSRKTLSSITNQKPYYLRKKETKKETTKELCKVLGKNELNFKMYPNCIKTLHFLTNLSIDTVYAERLFLKIKLVRNQYQLSYIRHFVNDSY